MADVFVGRAAELARIDAEWEQVLEGVPRVVWIGGQAGLGKSALAREWLRRTSGTGNRLVAVADADEQQGQFALVEQLGLWSTKGGPLAVGAELLQHVSLAASQGPLVLCVDDLQFCDAPSLSALGFALRRLQRDPVLALFLCRDGPTAPSTTSIGRMADSRGVTIDLDGLDRHEVATLAESMGRGRLTVAEAERLRAHTDGSPLHVVSLCRELTGAQLRSPGPLPAPRSFALVVTTVLAHLPEQAQSLARAAAMLGDESPLALAADVGNVPDAFEALDGLEAAGLAAGSRSPEGWSIRWFHPMVRAAVYEDLGHAEKHRLHARAATLTTGVPSLLHRAAASLGSDEVLAREFDEASNHAEAAGQIRLSAELSTRAYHLSGSAETASRRLAAAVSRLLRAGDYAEAHGLAVALDDLPESPALLACRARMAWLAGDTARAATLGRRVWESPLTTDSETKASVAEMLGQIELQAAHLDEAITWAQAGLSLPHLTATQRSIATAGACQALTFQGRTEEALARLEDLPTDAAAVPSERHPELRARGLAKMVGDEWGGAVEDLGTLAAGIGADPTPLRLMALAGCAEAEFRLGEWDSSLAHAEQAVSLSEDAEQLWALSFLHCMPVLVLAARGQWAEAEHHVDRAAELAQFIVDPATAAYLADAEVHLETCRGNVLAAIDAARPVLHDQAAIPREPGVLRLPVNHVSALIRVGRLDEADQELQVLQDRAEATGRASRLCSLARLRGEVADARRNTAGARHAFEEAVSLLDSANALEVGVVQLAFGRFLRRRGERRAATKLLMGARDAFDALGATPWTRQSETELGLTGHKTSGGSEGQPSWERLTPQEELVAELVCQGKTNQQVATELVLSPKTVGYHLSNVYAKLGVHSRTQLAARRSARPEQIRQYAD